MRIATIRLAIHFTKPFHIDSVKGKTEKNTKLAFSAKLTKQIAGKLGY